MKRMSIMLSLALAGSLISTPSHSKASEEKQRVMVTFSERIDDKVIQRLGGRFHHKFADLSIASVTVPKSVIPLLRKFPEIANVREEIQYKKAAEPVQQPIRWSVKKVNAHVTISKGYTGKGIKVGVIDTGISLNHEDLTVSGGVSTINGHTSYADDNGHGTHVAGIIAAKNNGVGTVGVAPEASLYAIKALDSEGYGMESDIALAIKWAIVNKMDIINMSLGSPDYSRVIDNYINIAADRGMMVVAAAGNNGTADGKENTIEHPAKNKNVIAVGAINKFDKRASFSASGSELDVSAPGDSVYSTYWNEGKNGYMVESGTSMAAPYVAGTIAVYKQKNPAANLRSVLMKNTIDLGAAGWDRLYGKGLVQTERDTVAPTMPVNFTSVHAGKGDVGVTWGASTEDVAFKGYELYRDGKMVKLLESGTSFHDYVTNNQYDYQMRAIDKAGNASPMTPVSSVSTSGVNYTDVTNADWYAPHVIYLSGKSIVTGYANGGFMAGKSVTRAEAISMIGRAIDLDGTKRTTSFKDVHASSFASGYIESALKAGIISKNSESRFYPEKKITRAEMALMLSKAYQLKATSTVSFTDVSESMAAYNAINLVETNGIASGYSDGTFRPAVTVTRGQFAVFTARANYKPFRIN